MFDRLIANILDVPKTEGLCLFSRQGALLYRRMPDFLPLEIYETLSRRLLGLYETMDDNFLPTDDFLLKFSEKWLMVRRAEHCFLVLWLDEKVNLASLRMVTNVALKSLQPAVLAGLTPLVTTPAPAPAPVPAPAAPTPAPAAVPVPPVEPDPVPAKTRRVYRGVAY